MRIGVVSDTHNNLRNVAAIVDIFNRRGVDHIVHTGDITQAKTLDVLADLTAPLTGVYGNNDLERDDLREACDRHGFDFVDPPRQITLGGRGILVVHDPLDIGESAAADIVLHGHNHQTVVERAGDRLTLNPGECAGHMTGYNTIAILDLATLAVDLERF